MKFKQGSVRFGILSYCNKVWIKMKFFSMGKSTELPNEEFRQQSMQLSNHFQLVPTSRMYKVLPPLPHTPSRYMSCLYLYLVITLIKIMKNGSLDMLEYEEMRPLTSSQGTALL